MKSGVNSNVVSSNNNLSTKIEIIFRWKYCICVFLSSFSTRKVQLDFGWLL